MKNKVINAAVCDARGVTEESLSGFDSIRINAAALIVSEKSKAILNKYNVSINAADTIEIPDGKNIVMKFMNGSGEIGPDSDGTDTFLMANGKLIVQSGSMEALRSYYKIMINGKALLPKSLRGQTSNIQVNGKVDYYPDGATILKSDTVIDDLFIARASNDIYYCTGKLFFTDSGINTEKIISGNMKFYADKILIAEGILPKIITAFDEETEIVKIPDGCRLIKEDIEISTKVIKRYGTRLCVCGDVSVVEAEALSSLEYLFVDGKVTINKNLEEAFGELDAVYEELEISDPDVGRISDRVSVVVGAVSVGKYKNGLRITDCAKVTIREDLDPEIITEKIKIVDCALVTCTKEQEEAVNFVSDGVAKIKVIGSETEDSEDESSYFSDPLAEGDNDTVVINAADYKM
ncbi:MAG: hypothetical protein IJT91_06290 [Clostridia bacterium]|nr:hypothetical protein [Clostridia bacterium]